MATRHDAAGSKDRGDCLIEAMAGLTGNREERRHEAVMGWAERELRLERSMAEKLYALAESEDLEPIYAFQLVRCGVGVLDLEPPEAEPPDTASQQVPPVWDAMESVTLADVDLERRLRQSFRRLRSLLAEHDSPLAAAAAFLAEPDVGPLSLA